MLVLSRHQQDQVVFPNLGITVHVLRIEGKTVRLGIEAPRDIPVMRHEIAEQWNQWRDYPVGERPRQLRHALRNRLHAATLGLHSLHRKMEQGDLTDMEPTILKVFRELESMDQEVSTFHDHPSRREAVETRKALLVEDNPNESELLAGYLRTCDFHVVTARDGVDALEYLECNEPPHVMLLDMNMPRMDGRTTICKIRGNPDYAGLKVFAVSGSTPEKSSVQIGPSGVDRWFNKPIRPDALVGEINRELAQCGEPVL